VASAKGPVAAGLREITARLCGPAAGTAVSRSGVWHKLLKKT
jgi:hypothetical protein